MQTVLCDEETEETEELSLGADEDWQGMGWI